jgi:hypothetical protein
MLHSVRVVDQRRGSRVLAKIGHPVPVASTVEQQSILEDDVVDHNYVRFAGGSERCKYCAIRPSEKSAYRIEVGLGAHEPDSTR